MIAIHLGVVDSPRLTENTAELVEPADYPAIRMRIREAIHGGEDLHVYIRNPACNNWFWDLVDYLAVDLVDDDLREQLKRRLDIQTLPDDLHSQPQLITQLDLLNITDPISRDEDVWNWILRNRLGSVWTVQTPSFNHLRDLVHWFATVNQPDFEVLKRKKEAIAERWKSRSQGQVRIAYEHFFADPHRGSLFLGSWQNLSPYYGEVLATWLTEEGCYNPNLHWIALVLPPLPLPPMIIDKLSSKAEAHWNRKLSEADVSLAEVLGNMSGLLSGELGALQSLVSRTHVCLSTVDLEEMRIRFSRLDEATHVIDKIVAEMPPPLPTPPQETWNAEHWIEWARMQYIPYKKWLIDHNVHCETSTKQSEMFEDWLYKSYPSFAASLDYLIYGAFAHIQRLIQDGYVVVWVLVDNLPLFWFQTLSDCMLGNGLLRSTEPQYFLSMLPSETSVSRKSALLGQLPSQIETMDFDTYFVRLWKERGATNTTISHTIDELRQQLTTPANLHLFIYNILDSLAHRPDHQIYDARDSEIASYLRNLSSDLSELLKKLAEIQKTILVVSTDHGSTKMLADSTRLDLPASAESDDVFEQHRRFIKVGTFEALDTCDWFFLQKERFGLRDSYAVARGNHYIGMKPSGYTHGGLSPEETVITLSVWELGEIPESIRLVVSHTSEPIMRGRSQTMSVTVRNPFFIDARNVSIILSKVGCLFEAEVIPSKTEAVLGPLEIQLPPKVGVQAGSAIVDMSISYEVAGLHKHQIDKLHIHVRELFKTELDDFDNMFRNGEQ